MAYWKGEKPPDDDMPKVLVERDGKIYAPAMFMHPKIPTSTGLTRLELMLSEPKFGMTF